MKRFFAILMVAILVVGMLPAVSVAATKQYATVVGGWLRLRSASSFNAETLNSYYTGTVVEILGSSGSWYHVETPDGRTGYMYGQYLRLGSSSGGGGGGGSSSSNAYVTSHNGYGVRLRSGPGTGYRVIRTYAIGTPVTVLERGSYWSKIKISGTVGYMMSQFLNFGSTPNPGDGTVTCYATIHSGNGYGVRLRTGPGKGYAKIGVYSVGTVVAVLEKGSVWDRIRVGSRVGWMMNEFLDYYNTNEVTSVSLNNYTPAVGNVLSVAAISPSHATVTYEWRVDGTTMGTASTYTVSSSDVGKVIQLKVKGTGSYTGSVKSAVTAKVISNTQVSSVKLNTSAPVVGNVLTATIQPSSATVIYAWKVGGYQVSNAENYTVKPEDVGKKIELIVTGTGNYSGTASAMTADVSATSGITAVSVVNKTNSTAGAAPMVGDTLLAAVTPEQATVNYQWKLDGVAIAGATQSTYQVVAGDLGKKLSVMVTGTNSYTGSAASEPTLAVVESATKPVVSGITLADAYLKYPYAMQLSADGGGSISWKLSGGTLPTGLNLLENGAITGTPTAEGMFTFSVVATNVAGSSEPMSFDIWVKLCTLNVNGGTGSSASLAADSVVTIQAAAAAEGQEFDQWTVTSGNGELADAFSAVTTFRMMGTNAEVTATYRTAEPVPTATTEPEATPTTEPAAEPTEEPTVAPTTEPEATPTTGPAAEPTEEPTVAPTTEPEATPTTEPAAEPTEEPTVAPTTEPEATPTTEPTTAPTEEPTPAPTEEPTPAPTEEPTPAPTEEPTPAPTEEPTPAPTEEPTPAPTEEPAPVKLSAPQNLRWAADGTYVSWDSVEGATEYVFYRVKVDTGNTGEDRTSATSYTFINSGNPGDVFYVKAVGGEGTIASDYVSATYQ